MRVPAYPPEEGLSPNGQSSWRQDALTATGLNMLAGVWLIIAPWVLGYSNDDPYWNDVLFGALVVLIGVVRIGGGLRTTAPSMVNGLIGIWVFISAFVLDSSSTASWNDVILGVIVFVLAMLSASASVDGARLGSPSRSRR